MATTTGIATLVLTPGTWVQGPSQAATSVSIPTIGGLQVSLNNGTDYFQQKRDQPPNPVTLKANLNEIYFRIFGGPINVRMHWWS